jgi:hypothetical protein
MKSTNQKIVSNKFKWIPMDERLDSLGLPLPPRSPEIRKPLLWIAIESQNNFVKDVYLVNETGENLETVIASTGGFQTLDDDVLGVSGSDIEYKNIANCDAVKIDEYDVIADSDYVLQIYIKVKLKGKWIDLKTSARKGGFEEEVLLWG